MHISIICFIKHATRLFTSHRASHLQFHFHRITTHGEIYKTAPPNITQTATTIPTTNPERSIGARAAAAFFEVDDAEAVEVEETVPEPAVAVEEDWPPLTVVPSWEPLPVKPTPVPAPDFMYCGRVSFVLGNS